MSQCPKCGSQNENSEVFCATCGTTLYATPVPTSPSTQGDAYREPYAEPTKPSGSNPGMLWLVLNSIFSFFYLVLAFCTCVTVINLIPGVIGIVFGAMAVSKFSAGRVDESRSNARISMIMFIVGAALAVLMVIALVVFGLIMGADILKQLPNLNYYYNQ